jgi:hypothetical protein
VSEYRNAKGCQDCGWRSDDGQPHASFCGGEIVTIYPGGPQGIIESPAGTPPFRVIPTGKAEVRSTSSTGGQKGVKLQRFDLIPIGPLTRLAEHYGKGALKYDNHQWRKGYEWSKSYAALLRHLTAWWNGEEYDVCPSTEEGCSFVTSAGEPFEGTTTENGRTCYNHTGSHHLDGVKWNAFTLDEFREVHPEFDDRWKGKI